MSFISQIYVIWFAKYIRFSKSMQKIYVPSQKNSASWDLQLGFNLAFERLKHLKTLQHVSISFSSSSGSSYIPY